MKISYNWLKQYVNTNAEPAEIADSLTFCGLEVESIEKHQSIKGGLVGMVVGQVLTKEKHPDADRLSITTVNIAAENVLHIVCGAANVAVGQKVVIATIGATLYPTKGEPFEIKKSKIRGALSEGMICAEDEIGLGASHEGIMVLDSEAQVGMPANQYFNISQDFIFEIGLTPNRADATSHIGVARDLVAVLNHKNNTSEHRLAMPDVNAFSEDNTNDTIQVIIEDADACPRYSGLVISGIEVKESPEWLKNALKTIGIKSINNIVDVTNYVLHETGQPLHAFDRDKIKSNIVRVKKFDAPLKFKTLDAVERTIGTNDLIICNDTEPMCIAGVFGGLNSGISKSTKSIFLESAYFNSVSVRKTSKSHNLKTDASFRFERGSDPNITVYALKRAALLIKEIAGGEISSAIIDIYPSLVSPVEIPFSYDDCERIIGKKIPHEQVKNILRSLEIEIASEGNDTMLLAIPTNKVDVKREIDVIEEVLRIYGYNDVEIPETVRSSLSYAQKPSSTKYQQAVSNFLSANGFYEIMCNSLTASKYGDKETSVSILNPLSSELDVMRQTMLYGGLESMLYNINRKKSDLKFYEFGKIYHYNKSADGLKKYTETNHLAIFITGNKRDESWDVKTEKADFYYVKGIVNTLLEKLGIANFKTNNISNQYIAEGLSYEVKKQVIAEVGLVSKNALKLADITTPVYYATFNWDGIMQLLKNVSSSYKELTKFPEVRRDLALLLDQAVLFDEVKTLAFTTEKTLLKQVNLFDVYEGEKLESGKKSYAVSFILQDEQATLTDKQIEKAMDKLMNAYREKLGAIIR